MTISAYILLSLTAYGLPVLFGAILVAALGLPVPASLLLLSAGALAAQGHLSIWWVTSIAIVAAVLGDLLGYSLGRWGSGRFITRLSRRTAGVEQMETLTRRWGGMGVFLTRWLMTPLGPMVNVTSGITRFSLPAFFCCDVAGETLWVAVYVLLGWLANAQVQWLSTTLGNLTWAFAGGAVLAVIGSILLHRYRPTTPTLWLT